MKNKLEGLYNISKYPVDKKSWGSCLNYLVTGLSQLFCASIEITDLFIEEYEEGQKHCGAACDIVVDINKTLGIKMCGVVSINVNINESVLVGGVLLPFANHSRLTSAQGLDILNVGHAEKTGWQIIGWDIDEYYEWQSYSSDERWRK